MDRDSQQAEHAPWLQMASRAVSVVEHPCIIKNVDKGIASLGGAVKLTQALRSKLHPQAGTESPDALPKVISASLRPDDPLAKRLLATPVTTNNLLLRVTLPKRTGRKRKRASSGPFLAESEETNVASNQNAHVPASSVFRRLQDNASRYEVAVAGLIDETHRFRNLPDIQIAASTNSTMQDIKNIIMPLNYSKLKHFNLNTASGADLTRSVGPSAEFLQIPVAHNYRFQQNTFVKYTEDGRGEVNLQRSLAYNGYIIIRPTANTVPQGSKDTLPPESTLSPYLQTLIANIRTELERRPIITRHLLYNTLGWDKREKLRQAAVYCGYFFESGPWREALIKWGVDPRKDPAYRKYQTVSFLSYKKTGTARHFAEFDKHVKNLSTLDPKDLQHQHTFDGKHVSETGNLFQFCDITDPFIRKILDTKDIRASCVPTAPGWFHTGTWAKATVILKDKMNRILAKEDVDNSIYQRIVTWPEFWDDQEIHAPYRAEYYDKQVHRENLKEHTVMLSVRWAARNPRYAFEKMEASSAPTGRQEGVENGMEEGEDEVPIDMAEEPDTAEAILNEGDDEDAEINFDGDSENEDDDDDDNDKVLDVDIDMDVDGEWEPDDSDNETLAPAAPQGEAGSRPFGGLFG